MDGIHDVGGMDGFGPVNTTETDGTFDEQWEGVRTEP
ncbi:MAG: nitrile hydratase beta subunit, partial [uncultured archaeon A07HR67]